MPDGDAAAMERHFYEQSFYEPHCSHPGCPEESDPQTHGHCECGEMVPPDSGLPCVNCLAIQARVPVRFTLSYDIAGIRFAAKSHRNGGPEDAAEVLKMFTAGMTRAIGQARAIALAAEARPDRIYKVNRLLRMISTKERGFFGSGDRVAAFSVGGDLRLRYMDERLGRKFAIGKAESAPDSFSHGGGLWRFVLSLRDFIEHAELIDDDFGQHWAYAAAPLAEIRALARDLGIAQQAEEVPF
jgi:hypothetical protein